MGFYASFAFFVVFFIVFDGHTVRRNQTRNSYIKINIEIFGNFDWSSKKTHTQNYKVISIFNSIFFLFVQYYAKKNHFFYWPIIKMYAWNPNCTIRKKAVVVFFWFFCFVTAKTFIYMWITLKKNNEEEELNCVILFRCFYTNFFQSIDCVCGCKMLLAHHTVLTIAQITFKNFHYFFLFFNSSFT